MTTSDQSNSGTFEKDVGVRLSEITRQRIREATESIRRQSMYESPIQIIYDQMQTQIDNEIIRAVQSYNITVNRDELIKALEYDRNQYQKGFEDARRQFQQKIGIWAESTTETCFYTLTTYTCPFCGRSSGEKTRHCPDCGAELYQEESINERT